MTAVAVLFVTGAVGRLLREQQVAEARRAGRSTTAVDESSNLRAPASSSSAERESMPVPEAAPAVPPMSEVADDSTPRVVVVVRDSDSAPIPGAEVEITGRGPLGKWQSNEVGSCKLPVEPWTGALDLRVAADGFVTSCFSLGRKEEIVVVLKRSVAVQGRVIAADTGSPLASALVSVGVFACGEPELEAQTDVEGRFEVSGLPLGTDITWRVSADGFVTLGRRLQLNDPGHAIELELQRGRSIDLLVVDAQSGAPIEGANVWGGSAGACLSDAQGLVRTSAMASFEDEEVSLTAAAPGYCLLHATVSTLELKSNEPLRLPLLLGARIEGSVLDPKGAPLGGLDVRLDVDFAIRGRSRESEGFREVNLPPGWWLESPHTYFVSTSDVNGRFVFEGLEPLSPWYRVEVRRGPTQLAGTQKVPTLGPPGTTTPMQLAVDLASICVVTGTLTLNGEPERGYVGWRGPTRGGGQVAGLNGRFRLEDVEPGRIELSPMPDGLLGYGDCKIFPQTWTVQATAEEEARLDIALELEMSTIAGRVVDVSGAPRAGIDVTVMSREACWAAVGQTTEDGSFDFKVRAGPWTYFASAGEDPDSARREGLAAGTRDVELVLPGRGMLRLRVVESRTRTPQTELVVRFEDVGKEVHVIDTRGRARDPDGWQEFDLRPGAWRVFVCDPENERTIHLPVDANIMVRSGGEPQTLELERERGLELDVQLASGQDPWPADVSVLALEASTADQVVLDASGWNIGQAYRGINVFESRTLDLDPSGHAHVTALRPGPYRFVAFPETIAMEPAEAVITGNEKEPIQIRWTVR